MLFFLPFCEVSVCVVECSKYMFKSKSSIISKSSNIYMQYYHNSYKLLIIYQAPYCLSLHYLIWHLI